MEACLQHLGFAWLTLEVCVFLFAKHGVWLPPRVAIRLNEILHVSAFCVAGCTVGPHMVHEPISLCLSPLPQIKFLHLPENSVRARHRRGWGAGRVGDWREAQTDPAHLEFLVSCGGGEMDTE